MFLTLLMDEANIFSPPRLTGILEDEGDRKGILEEYFFKNFLNAVETLQIITRRTSL